VTRASSSACSSGSSSMEPAAWRLRLVYVFCAVAFDASRDICVVARRRRSRSGAYASRATARNGDERRRAQNSGKALVVRPAIDARKVCCLRRRRAPPGAIDAYVTTLRNALARGGRADRRAVLRGLVRLLAIAAHGAHRWSSCVQAMISLAR
jgi:hypothetical protein